MDSVPYGCQVQNRYKTPCSELFSRVHGSGLSDNGLCEKKRDDAKALANDLSIG